ncbi:hypothetical protein LSAT2_000420 [Lamellibrachia satsuma]|nr:hypothetical protein LSAT2_000420 [Lamellibrachia satsuma]
MSSDLNTVLFVGIVLGCISIGSAIQCYQCDSNEDKSCPSNKPFDLYLNALVDCNSFEADIPGIFCMKITQQSPGWYGWKKITRRCGRRSSTGVAWGCHWDYEENGVWKEVCYCEDKDGCNASSQLRYGATLVIITTLSLLFGHL